jgi:hypothetical protein
MENPGVVTYRAGHHLGYVLPSSFRMLSKRVLLHNMVGETRFLKPFADWAPSCLQYGCVKLRERLCSLSRILCMDWWSLHLEWVLTLCAPSSFCAPLFSVEASKRLHAISLAVGYVACFTETLPPHTQTSPHMSQSPPAPFICPPFTTVSGIDLPMYSPFHSI